jgi:LEA14-like dessication related protein
MIAINTQLKNHTRGLFNLSSILCPLSGIATPNIRKRIIIAKNEEANAITNKPTSGVNLDVNGITCKKKRKKIAGTLITNTSRSVA